MSKKPSIAVRAKKWAADVKHTAQAVRIARNAPDRKPAPVNIEPIKDPFIPRNPAPGVPPHDGPEPAVEEPDEADVNPDGTG